LVITIPLFGQGSPNCFLEDYYPKYISSPPSIDTIKPSTTPNVTVTINGADTLGPVSNYIFGNATAVWVGENVNNTTLVPYLQQLSPSLIRFPGGSWSNIYFWNGLPGDIPESIYDCSKYGAGAETYPKVLLHPQSGAWYYLTPDQYYNLRSQLGAEGLISVNYGYARYGLSADPIGQAAHLAADWVRYDAGQTKFWEVGNENAGQWEAGWMIDTTTNLDGQPKVITGRIYGKHFKVFVDSMKAAAAEIATTIYIGGIVLHFDGSTSSNPPDKTWNQEFFNEVGDSADFYVMHNYYGSGSSSVSLNTSVTNAHTEIINNINFINSDIAAKGASSKPIALTEWNSKSNSSSSPADKERISICNGLQAVTIIGDMLNNNCNMSCRWLIANQNTDGMFYWSSSPTHTLWDPRPDFYYLYYLKQFVGDHMVQTSSSYTDLLAYASRFSSNHTGVVVVNKGASPLTVRILPNDIGVGDKYYVYSITGDTMGNPPIICKVNNTKHDPGRWGPLSGLTGIKAWSYTTGNPLGNDSIKFSSPGNSVQFILVDSGRTYITNVKTASSQSIVKFSLEQNYPNPFNPQTVIFYSLPKASTVTLKVYDVLGREVETLVCNEKKVTGTYQVRFNGLSLPSGVYFYRLTSENYVESKKMLLIK
jgi:hypothetical protein